MIANDIMTNRMICPYCGGVGRAYHRTWIKILYPMLFLDKKFYCNECKKIFVKSLQPGELPRPRKITFGDKVRMGADRVIKLALVLFILWILYVTVMEVILQQ